MVKDHKELVVWERSVELVEAVYRLSKELPKEEMFGLTSQIRRAAVSIPSNIAEGTKRKSTADYIRFLSIAKGSAAEVETQLILIQRLYGLDIGRANELLTEVQKMLAVLTQRLSTKS